MGFWSGVGHVISVICNRVIEVSNQKFLDAAVSLSHKSSSELEEIFEEADYGKKVGIVLALASKGEMRNAIGLARQGNIYKSEFKKYAEMEGPMARAAQELISEWDYFNL